MGAAVVPTKEQHSIFRDLCKRGNKRRTGLLYHRTKRPRGRNGRRFVHRVPGDDPNPTKRTAGKQKLRLQLLEATRDYVREWEIMCHHLDTQIDPSLQCHLHSNFEQYVCVYRVLCILGYSRFLFLIIHRETRVLPERED
eukprot:sb/3474309/